MVLDSRIPAGISYPPDSRYDHVHVSSSGNRLSLGLSTTGLSQRWFFVAMNKVKANHLPDWRLSSLSSSVPLISLGTSLGIYESRVYVILRHFFFAASSAAFSSARAPVRPFGRP